MLIFRDWRLALSNAAAVVDVRQASLPAVVPLPPATAEPEPDCKEFRPCFTTSNWRLEDSEAAV